MSSEEFVREHYRKKFEVSEDFTREQLQDYWLGDQDERDERRLYDFALTLWRRGEQAEERHMKQRTELTAARKVVEAARELRIEEHKNKWVEILDRIDDLIDEYDKVVGK